jgi:hypothetical protein
MEKWEYKHEWIKAPYDEKNEWDVADKSLNALNRWGAQGWEVCSLLEGQGYWMILLKRKVEAS